MPGPPVESATLNPYDHGMHPGGTTAAETKKPRGRACVLSLAAVLLALACALCAGCDSTASARQSDSSKGFLSGVAAQAAAWQAVVSADLSLTLCELRIPRIALDVAVVEGTDPEDLERGPGHWSETPLPGEGGRVVISGHRSTYGSPFLRLDELGPGDRIELALPYGTAEYEVIETLIVRPDEVEVVGQRGLEELSLATCHPPGSDEFRMVVQAQAVASTATR